MTGPAVSSGADTTEPSALNVTVWPSRPHTGKGRSHGTSQTAAFDRWFRYPAGFATDYATYLISRLGLTQGQMVLDCFAGSGVTGTAARAAGLAFGGVEAHPMIAELAQLKLDHKVDGATLLAAAEQVREEVARRSPDPKGLLAATRESETDLVERSFSAATAQTLFALREAVRSQKDLDTQRYLKWALLACLRDVAGVKVGWPYQRPGLARRPRYSDAVKRFSDRVSFMAHDIDSVTASTYSRTVVCGDSRGAATWRALMGESLGHGCVASPPYLNNFDYADATRLEAYFWGEARTWAELCTNIRTDMITATTQQSSVGEAVTALKTLQSTAIGSQATELVESLGEQRAARTRGKEYDRVLPAYFCAINEVLCNLADHLVPGAPVAWLIGDSAPYGVYVDTPRLIGELADASGLEVEADVVLRQRGNRWGTLDGRHDQPLTERLLVLRRS